MHRQWLIGTSQLCDIVVEDEYVSSKHCKLFLRDNEWEIEDLESTNGTFVNGDRVTKVCKIHQNDQITLGRAIPMPWPQECSNLAQVRLTLPTDNNRIIIGRSDDCDVIIDRPMVSNFHAEVAHTSSGWFIRDLGSTNGTFYKGEFVGSRTLVKPNTTLCLGSEEVLLCAERVGKIGRPADCKPAIQMSHVSLAVGKKCLVNDVSMTVYPGELVAIMGSSGAGKSTLLASLAGCLQPCAGQICVANTDIYQHGYENRGETGFVPQDDILHSELTVKAALSYTAKLRLPKDCSKQEIDDRVNNIVARLGLSGTEQTLIGHPGERGISGGQRKRVSIASELITEPPVLMLDEPTSGLSSNDSLALVRLLRSLANQGKTVLLTIHQPSIEILELVDALVVISRDETTNEEGRLVWYGPAYPEAAEFFEPHAKNIARPDAEAILRGLAKKSTTAWMKAYSQTLAYEKWGRRKYRECVDRNTFHSKQQPSVFNIASQFKTLVYRMIEIKLSDKFNSLALLAQAPVIAVLIALVIGNSTMHSKLMNSGNYQSTAKGFAMASFLVSLASIWFGCSNSIREVVAERSVYKRERLAGLSRVAYVSSKVFVFSLLCLIQCVILIAIVGSGCGFESNRMLLFLVLFLAANIGVLIGLITSSLAKTTDSATALLPLLVLPLVILGGSIVPLSDLSNPIAELANVMPSRWAFEGVFLAESNVRPMLEITDRAHLGHTINVDMAEQWFPFPDTRATCIRTIFVLFTQWIFGLVALSVVTRSDGS